MRSCEAGRPANLPTSDQVVDALKALLPRLPGKVIAAVVYGSVATSRHHADSDVDALVITDRPWSDDDLDNAVALYSRFVTDVGLRLDPRYPLEQFTVEECRHAVGLPTPVERRNRSSSARQALPLDDREEIIQALSGSLLVVAGDVLVTQLRAGALQLEVLPTTAGRSE